MPEPPKTKAQKEPGQVGLFALFAFAVGSALVWDMTTAPGWQVRCCWSTLPSKFGSTAARRLS